MRVRCVRSSFFFVVFDRSAFRVFLEFGGFIEHEGFSWYTKHGLTQRSAQFGQFAVAHQDIVVAKLDLLVGVPHQAVTS